MTDPDRETSPPAKPPHAEETPPREILTRLMLGLGLWGLVLGIGAMLFGVGENGGIQLGFRPLRGLIVWGCVGGFLAFWGWLLRSSQR